MAIQGAPDRSIPAVPSLQGSRLVMSWLAQPWFDSTALWTMTRWYMPLSRAWAAAGVSEGSLERFQAELPVDRIGPAARLGLARALQRTGELKNRLKDAEAHWDDLFFAARPVPSSALFNAERIRRRASHAYMLCRSGFALVRLGAGYPAVRYEIPSPAEVMAELQPLLSDPDAAYAPPDPLPPVAVSHRIEHPTFSEYWLRFPSAHPDGDDIAWAHVREPKGVSNPPSLIHVHGLGVEFESLEGIEDEVDPIVTMGVRLVRLEALWHNRRRLPGLFGGEPFLSRQPLSGIELFLTVAREMAVLVSWCRGTSRGRVAIGGTSMGALSTQTAASRAQDWPTETKADVLWLVTTSDDIGSLAFQSALAKAVGLPEQLTRVGWTPQSIAALNPLGEVRTLPIMAPEDIVVVLGRRDEVTPYVRGAAMVARWGVPERNLFQRELGHFSVPLGLLGDRRPLTRLVERLRAGGPP
ncbi:MAG TPA: hypothetical protein VED46_05890 [Alphaproteobacteria bacterium]|nr:hypothetical protein [Alphaproteobacteria bacterium]